MDSKTQDMLRQAYQMLAEKNKDKVSVGKAGGDMVTVTANLQLQLTKVEISDAAMTEGKAVIADLIVAATNQALIQAQQMMQQEMMAIAQQMGLNR